MCRKIWWWKFFAYWLGLGGGIYFSSLHFLFFRVFDHVKLQTHDGTLAQWRVLVFCLLHIRIDEKVPSVLILPLISYVLIIKEQLDSDTSIKTSSLRAYILLSSGIIAEQGSLNSSWVWWWVKLPPFEYYLYYNLVWFMMFFWSGCNTLICLFHILSFDVCGSPKTTLFFSWTRPKTTNFLYAATLGL